MVDERIAHRPVRSCATVTKAPGFGLALRRLHRVAVGIVAEGMSVDFRNDDRDVTGAPHGLSVGADQRAKLDDRSTIDTSR